MGENRRVVLSKATIEDIPTIQSVARETFPITYASILTPQQNEYMMEMMYSTESLMNQMRSGHVFIIAWDYLSEPPRAVGYVSVEKEANNKCHLQKIYVHPDFQNNGLGKILWNEAALCGQKLCGAPTVMELNVNRNNSAVDFYKHLGMHIDREGDFDIGNGFFMNDYIMQITFPLPISPQMVVRKYDI